MLVLLNAKSSRRARLKTQIGELRVTARKVRVRGGERIATSLLRVNDRFRTRAKVRRAARRAAYWRIKSRKLKVTQRASTLSAAELQQTVEGLRADLAKLTKTVEDLARYTVAEFEAVRAEMASLRTDLTALRSEFTALSAELDALADDVAALQTQVQSLITDLAALDAELDALQNDLADLTADLATLTATVGALSGQLGDLGNLGGTVEDLLTGLAPGDLTGALADVAGLQSDVVNLQSQVNGLQADVDVLCGPTSPLNALC
jgi:chromosome segregation ATPase